MVKALVFAESIHQYRNFCRNFNLNHREYRYVIGDGFGEVQGWWIDMPVILLEGYKYNRNYDVYLMHMVGRRFENIGFLSEGEIYNESIKL